MTYQEFKENVTTVIQNRLGSNVKVTIQEIIKIMILIMMVSRSYQSAEYIPNYLSELLF